MSQRIIKGFPKLKSNPSKLKTFLSIALIVSPFYTNAIEFFTVISQLREWGARTVIQMSAPFYLLGLSHI